MLSSSILVRTGRSATTVGSRVIMGPKAFLHRQWLTTTTTGRPPAPRVLPKSTTTPAQPHKLASQVSEAGSGLPLGGAGGGGGFFNLHNKTPVSWTSLFVVSVVAATAVTYYKIERERRLESAMGKVVSTGKPAIGGPWSLVDMDGQIVTEQSFVGKWTLLYFGFARCPDICPAEMNKVARVLDTMKQQYPELYQKIVPVFVSVDPARDSIKVLKDFGKDFHPDYIFLTGTPAQVQQMAKKYRVYVSKADESEDGEDYLVDHSIVVYFHDETGDLADCFTQSMRSVDVVEKIVEKMLNKPK